MSNQTIRLSFDRDTIVLSALPEVLRHGFDDLLLDERIQQYRAPAHAYRAIVETLRRHKIAHTDEARGYEPVATGWQLTSDRQPYPHQLEAVQAWWQAGGCGVVVLPTGTGKTFTAMLAIQQAQRPTLIVTPTIDLLNQWYSDLSRSFGIEVGLMGGGHHEIRPLTVTTYDSAYIHLERWGNRFGLLVFDECHHLPGASYQTISIGSIAPYRLGLTATPERGDGQHELLPRLIGPIIYEQQIKELAGEFLADYTTQRLYVDLSADEQERYRIARETYRNFVVSRGIRMGGPSGWQRFILESTRSDEGRLAFEAYQEQKRLERAASAKLAKLGELLHEHYRDRIIIFTADNATVYQIARQYLVPPITHQTKAKERKKLLERFHRGEYTTLVTSQVLNEGVDVPAAAVGIILSGTGSTRENVQRLGRLLRKHGDKQATLYEIIARGTSEEFTSDRRRQHTAFQ